MKVTTHNEYFKWNFGNMPVDGVVSNKKQQNLFRSWIGKGKGI